jgi:putative addiction module CopG family antidote
MEPLQISLSPELSEFVEQQVIGGGYQGPSDYVSSLVEAKRLEMAREELEALLEAGLNSPSRPVTPEYWQELKARIAAKANTETTK